MRQVWSDRAIEELAAQRLREFGQRFQLIQGPPVPIDHIIEHLFDLFLSWEEIKEDEDGTLQIYGAVRPESREIVLNTRHLELFESNLGLERFTKGHELGHWELHVNKADETPALFPELVRKRVMLTRQASKGPVWTLRGGRDMRGDQVAGDVSTTADSPLEAHQVNRYAAALLMPEPFVRQEVRCHRSVNWAMVADLARRFEVSHAAMRVRLTELRLIFVDRDGNLHRTKAEAGGQQALPLD